MSEAWPDTYDEGCLHGYMDFHGFTNGHEDRPISTRMVISHAMKRCNPFWV